MVMNLIVPQAAISSKVAKVQEKKDGKKLIWQTLPEKAGGVLSCI
jgi:hypothetical protein